MVSRIDVIAIDGNDDEIRKMSFRELKNVRVHAQKPLARLSKRKDLCGGSHAQSCLNPRGNRYPLA